MRAAIKGWGSALPPKQLGNRELASRLGVSEDWIFGRTGIRSRRKVDGEATSFLAIQASRAAIERSGIPPHDIDLVMVATSTPDFLFPSTASLVQAELGCLNAGAFDLNAACSGFLYGMALADSSIESGASRRILLCGADTLTAVTDYSDAHSCVLFGDGAGAVVFEAAVDDSGLGPFILRSDGSDPSLLYVDADEGLIKMQGREVYRRAVDGMTKAVTEVLARSGIGIADVGLVIAHQANARIIEAVASRLDIDPQKLPVSIEMIGNTASASIPIAICQAADEGLLSAGDVVVITAFGAGFTWGAGLIRWDPVRSPNQATGERLLVDVALTGTP